MTFSVNGISFEADISAGMLLADILRDQLALIAVELRCSGGTCGACTVLLGGYPVLSCLTLAALCENATIVTSEYLVSDPVLGALRQLLLARGDATRCGACAPGILASAAALLAANPRPTRDDVRHALAGHACRCLGYSAIIEAVVGVEQNVTSNASAQHSSGIGHLNARFSHQQSIDLAAKTRDADPISALRSGIADCDLAVLLDQTAARFQWNSRWKGWRFPPEGRLRRGLGASAQSAQPKRIDPKLAVMCFVDLEFDRETGSVSLNSVIALATAPRLLSQDASVVEAGIMEGLFVAFHHDPNAANGSVRPTELFPVHFPTAIDAVDVTCTTSNQGSGERPPMSQLKDITAGAMVCAIAGAIFHATGISAPMPPFSVERLSGTTRAVR